MYRITIMWQQKYFYTTLLTCVIWLVYDMYEYSVRCLTPFYSDWIFNKQMIKGEVK